jgi:uncharacterized membrane protein YhiD involved in acid resistance
MKNLLEMQELINPNIAQIGIIPTLFSFFMCVLMSFIVREFYIKRSFSLTGKAHIGSIIPILSTVVFLVIVIVKSSLALSLGLVGALSIVRFRTPIKEPEELVYLFLAIAIGLGYAAGQVLITTIITLSILLIIFIWLSNRKIAKTNEYNLVIKWTKKDVKFENILKEITPIVENLKLVRLDKGPSGNTSVMLIVPFQEQPIEAVSNKLYALDNSVHVTFFEAKTNW